MPNSALIRIGIMVGVALVSARLSVGQVGIVVPADASSLEKLAGHEIRRYLYVRTGVLVPVAAGAEAEQIKGDRIVIGRKDRDAVIGVAGAALSGTITRLQPQEYLLKTLANGGDRTLIIAGGDEMGVLYGAYRFAEHLGVRFFLEGDVAPDDQIGLVLPDMDDHGSPLFALRGIQPFHAFPEGPDWWDLDAYLAIIAQLPKLRMNFVGFHTYPEGAAEPLTWIGPPEEVGMDGRVRASYPSRHFSTVNGTWGYEARKTSDYACGAAMLFADDDHCQDVQRGMTPWPDSPEKCNEMFNRFGEKLSAAFEFARRLGVTTCIGTETPLTVPMAMRVRLKPGEVGVQPVGGSATSCDSPIDGTDDDTLYRSVRSNVQSYWFSLPRGSYRITLKFCEITQDAAGKRVFSVRVQGRPVIEKLDVFANVGKNRACDCTVPSVAVTDGTLTVDFVPVVERPCISAIVVEGPETVKINCGGQAWGDYLGDEARPELSASDIERIYEGMFTRIMRAHPLDYYWLWTPENWTWWAVSDQQVLKTMIDVRAAIAAAEKVKPPFGLATCGWVLGPPADRVLFDRELPKAMPISCINRAVGHDPVEPAFAEVSGRDKWAIPWLEDDPALLSAQLWVGRMRKDAADAKAYGCTGLMGLHWRTRVLGPNISALAAAAWDQSNWPSAAVRMQGADGGRVETFAGKAIEGTELPELYRTQRVGLRSYCIPATSGWRAIVLYLAELTHTEKGKRIFSVKVQGKPAIDKLDIFSEAGHGKALIKRIEPVHVTDGWIVIEFEAHAGEACIAAVQDDGSFGTHEYNCGGPACGVFEADLKPALTTGRYLPTTDFYDDWARQCFGPEVAGQMAACFERIDGNLPRPSNWIGGPGCLFPASRPSDEIAREYAFVGEIEAIRHRVQGAGNLERFDYWLNSFRFMEATARINSLLAEQNTCLESLRKAPDEAGKRRIAREQLLPIRIRLVEAIEQAYVPLLATVTNTSELGTITNLEQHSMPNLLTRPGEEMARALGEPLPPEAMPALGFAGASRLIVPVSRTVVNRGETLKLKIMLLDRQPRSPILHWRPMGRGRFQSVPARHKARAVYEVTFPPDAFSDDVEYYVEAESSAGTLRFPPSAPAVSQTVIVTEPN